MSIDELVRQQREFDNVRNAILDSMMLRKHAPHLGMSCEEYERLIAEAKAEE